MILRDCIGMLKSLGCVKVASTGEGFPSKAKGRNGVREGSFMTRLYYYYQFSLRRTLQRPVILLSIFTAWLAYSRRIDEFYQKSNEMVNLQQNQLIFEWIFF
ncbi:hypothetical protein [Terrimonas alba]|uniref:hypothetical protein n=1 Tax=Terrimonas alba TaxID=3349636 RepID=UPI0035F3A7CC